MRASCFVASTGRAIDAVASWFNLSNVVEKVSPHSALSVFVPRTTFKCIRLGALRRTGKTSLADDLQTAWSLNIVGKPQVTDTSQRLDPRLNVSDCNVCAWAADFWVVPFVKFDPAKDARTELVDFVITAAFTKTAQAALLALMTNTFMSINYDGFVTVI